MPKILFSANLQHKIDLLKAKRTPLQLGRLTFASPFLLAPMSAICTSPFRLLMEALGAGGTVSELISCHGINHGNEKTLKMLVVHKEEQNTGIQLFGEDAQAMAQAAQTAAQFDPKFIDINMGCPVRKVVTKGGGSALMRDTTKLGHFFSSIKKAINIPLSIKIRTGWDSTSLNALEIINIAYNEGIEFVAVHGRTRTQQYTGASDWSYLEDLAAQSPLPIIGNGDLHTAYATHRRWQHTQCAALMMGRGPLRDPFLFLQSYDPDNLLPFYPSDYLEVAHKFFALLQEFTDRERTLLVQMRKHIVWMAAGLPGVAQFRGELFTSKTIRQTLDITDHYFSSLGNIGKQIDLSQSFMAGGHG